MVHKIIITDREKLEVLGVDHVYSFDEKEIAISTNLKDLVIRGNGLHITQLDLDKQMIIIEGWIDGMEYLKHYFPEKRKKFKWF